MFYSSPDGITWAVLENNIDLRQAHIHYQHSKTLFTTIHGYIIPTLSANIYIRIIDQTYDYIKWVGESKREHLEWIRSQLHIVKEESIISDTDSDKKDETVLITMDSGESPVTDSLSPSLHTPCVSMSCPISSLVDPISALIEDQPNVHVMVLTQPISESSLSSDVIDSNHVKKMLMNKIRENVIEKV